MVHTRWENSFSVCYWEEEWVRGCVIEWGDGQCEVQFGGIRVWEQNNTSLNQIFTICGTFFHCLETKRFFFCIRRWESREDPTVITDHQKHFLQVLVIRKSSCLPSTGSLLLSSIWCIRERLVCGNVGEQCFYCWMPCVRGTTLSNKTQQTGAVWKIVTTICLKSYHNMQKPLCCGNLQV